MIGQRSYTLFLFLTFGALTGCGGSSTPRTMTDASEAPSEETRPVNDGSVTTPKSLGSLQQTVERNGIEVAFFADPVSDSTNEFYVGDDLYFRFRITDATDTAVRNAYPAAWIDRAETDEATTHEMTVRKAESFIRHGLLSQPDVNLNSYFVMSLNDDGTITVVDPLFTFGGTKLLAMLQLDGPGEDWVLTSDQSRVFVSIPESRSIAVISTADWKIIETILLKQTPGRVALQPDGHYLWVATNGVDSGVTVIEAESLKVAAEIPTGSGTHEFAFDQDDHHTFITNSESDTVTIVDVASLKIKSVIETGRQPVSIAWGKRANQVYVTHASADGITSFNVRGRITQRIAVPPPPKTNVSDDQGVPSAEIQSQMPALGEIRFEPKGRFAFVVDSQNDRILILDSSIAQVVREAPVQSHPHQIAFSDDLAYVRHLGSEIVQMIPLKDLGDPGHAVSLVEFPGGQKRPNEGQLSSLAPAIVQAPGANAVLVANPADRAVYFYKEGMAAPMGSFTNYGQEPRAVLAVDRSLKERFGEGVYETTARLSQPGRYDVVFLLDTPRVVHSFSIDVHENPQKIAAVKRERVEIKASVNSDFVVAGKPVQVAFGVGRDGQPVASELLTRCEVRVILAPGVWHTKLKLNSVTQGDGTLTFIPPRQGTYYLYLQSPELGLSDGHQHSAVLQVAAAPPSATADNTAANDSIQRGDSEL